MEINSSEKKKGSTNIRSEYSTLIATVINRNKKNTTTNHKDKTQRSKYKFILKFQQKITTTVGY